MDETQIAAQLADTIQQEVHVPAPVVPEEPGESAFTSNVELNVNAYGQQLSDYFALDRMAKYQEESQQQLRSVFQWAAKKSNAGDVETVFQTIRALELELGIAFKDRRLQRLAQWVELDNKTSALRAHQEMIRHG